MRLLKVNPRLIARLRGGLGNQMFIYAAGRALAQAKGAELRLDQSSGFHGDKYQREFVLDAYHIAAKPATPSESFAGPLGPIRQKIWRKLSRAGWGGEAWRFIDEGSPLAGPLARTTFLDGYWQSAKYFEAYHSKIRAEFARRRPLAPSTEDELREIMAAKHPIAICVRSFAEVPASERGRVVDAGYYRRAIDRVLAERPSARLFLFTDAPKWVREMLGSPVTILRAKPDNHGAGEDLELMRACRDFIVGNGTLHWWGAWLADSAGKHVIAPRQVAVEKPEFFPPDWELL